FLLGQLFHMVPIANMDHDLLLFYLKTINENISGYLEDRIISEFLIITEYLNPTTFSSFSQELKDNFLQLVKAVGSSEHILYTTTYDKLEEQFGNLMACDSSESYYQQQWHRWYRLKLSSFIVEKLERLYDEKSSYEI